MGAGVDDLVLTSVWLTGHAREPVQWIRCHIALYQSLHLTIISYPILVYSIPSYPIHLHTCIGAVHGYSSNPSSLSIEVLLSLLYTDVCPVRWDDTPCRNRLSYAVHTFYHLQPLLVIASVTFTSVRSFFCPSLRLSPLYLYLLTPFSLLSCSVNLSRFSSVISCALKFLTSFSHLLTSHFSFIPPTHIHTPTFSYFIPIIYNFCYILYLSFFFLSSSALKSLQIH